MLNAIRELCIEAIAAGESPSEALKFENWILVSPDIDAGVARAQIEGFASHQDLITLWRSPQLPKFLRGRFTIYASPEDRALWFSQILFRSKLRVGELSLDYISDPCRTTSRNPAISTLAFARANATIAMAVPI